VSPRITLIEDSDAWGHASGHPNFLISFSYGHEPKLSRLTNNNVALSLFLNKKNADE